MIYVTRDLLFTHVTEIKYTYLLTYCTKSKALIQTQLQRTTLSHIQSTIVNKKYGKTFLTLCTAGADCTGAKVQGKQVRLKLQPCLPTGQGSWFLLNGSDSQHGNAL